MTVKHGSGIAEKPRRKHILPPLIKGGERGVMAPGFKAAGISCGIKKTGAKDLAMILSATPAYCAGMFTRNRVKAAPVLIDMERVKTGRSRGIVVNSGNANCCNGRQGECDALAMVERTAKELGLETNEVLVASTGVIGRRLPVQKVLKALPELVRGLRKTKGSLAAKGIMTTDTVPKESALRLNCLSSFLDP